MAAFIAPAALTKTTFTHAPLSRDRPSLPAAPTARPAKTRMASSPYYPTVDEFFAKDVRAQYIAKACPTGVPPPQCIEGNVASAPYAARTLIRQSQLRYRQLPVAVKIHNMYETRRHALVACHGCAHEEARVLRNPLLAAAMALGQAEASRACSRYMRPAGPAEAHMVRAVEARYSAAVNPGGVFSTACTDGQARYEAYLAQTRGRAVEFRARQYSGGQQAAMAFAARRRALARGDVCDYEEKTFVKFGMVAGAMRPAFGYFTPFVTLPGYVGFRSGVAASYMEPTQASAVAALGTFSSSAMPQYAGINVTPN